MLMALLMKATAELFLSGEDELGGSWPFMQQIFLNIYFCLPHSQHSNWKPNCCAVQQVALVQWAVLLSPARSDVNCAIFFPACHHGGTQPPVSTFPTCPCRPPTIVGGQPRDRSVPKAYPASSNTSGNTNSPTIVGMQPRQRSIFR